jgi:hypothetical protein
MKKIITQLTAVVFVALALGLSAAAQNEQNTRSDQIYGSGSFTSDGATTGRESPMFGSGGFTDGGVIGSGTAAAAAVTGDNGGMIGSGTRTAAPSAAGSVYDCLHNWLEGLF